MTKWLYRGSPLNSIKDIPECCPFVVYRIDFQDDTYYIGSKQIYSTRRIKLSKKRSLLLWKGKGPKPKYETVVKESDWKIYCSSSKLVKDRLEKGENATFTIVDFFNNKRDMLLFEAGEIIKAFLPLDPKCLNSWVSIKMFKGKE